MPRPPLVVLMLVLVALAGALGAARVYGTVFDEDLQAARAVVQINTTPGQQLITTDGTYEFEIPAGTYRLAAVGDNSSAEKTLAIQASGAFRIDLILLPGVPPEDAVLADLLDVPEVNDPSPTQTPAPFPFVPVAALVAVILLAAVAYVHRDKLPWRHRSKSEPSPSPAMTSATVAAAPSRIFTADQTKVMQALSSFGNRASQKDLRKALHFWSEAKVSMELTELEDLGIIQKIKKGRGNVIRKAG